MGVRVSDLDAIAVSCGLGEPGERLARAIEAMLTAFGEQVGKSFQVRVQCDPELEPDETRWWVRYERLGEDGKPLVASPPSIACVPTEMEFEAAFPHALPLAVLLAPAGTGDAEDEADTEELGQAPAPADEPPWRWN